MQGSIDTLKLNLQDYQVKKDANILIHPGLIDNATGEQEQKLLYIGDGYKIEGAKAMLNTSAYNLTLTNNGAFLQCSVPKICNGRNDVPVTGEQTKEVLTFLEADLKDKGIHTNLQISKLSRLDVFKQDNFRYTFPDYVPVFSLLNGKRQNRRDYGTTYLYGNTQRELCIYDKGVEQQNSKGHQDITPTNQVRAELRLLFHRPVMKATGMNTATDLIKNYGELTPVYNKEIQKYFSVHLDERDEQRQYYLFTGDVEKEMSYIKQLYGGKFGMKQMKHYISCKALYCISEEISIPLLIDVAVRVSTYDDNAKRVLKARLERYIKELLFTWKALPGQLKQLYDELYLKFAV